MAPSLYLIDGTNLAYRAYYAFIRRPLYNSRGMNTSAIYGFAQSLLKIQNEESPDYMAVCWDSRGKTVRHEQFEEYKATREKMPSEMATQLPYIEQFVEALNIPFLSVEGYEADDIIGALAVRYAGTEQNGQMECSIVTGDKDMSQLVRPGIRIYNPTGKGGVKIYGPEEVEEKWGVPPERIPDLLALMGDSSDNVPGVRGIGEKRGTRLVQSWGSLEEIYDSIDEVGPPSVKSKLLEQEEKARLSHELVTIQTDLDIDVDLDDLKAGDPDLGALQGLCTELEMMTLLEKYDIRDPERNPAIETDYRLVSDTAELDRLCSAMQNADLIAFDVEATSTDARTADPIGLAIATEPGRAWYVPMTSEDEKKSEFLFQEMNTTIWDEARDRLLPLLADADIQKGGHNVKYDLAVLERVGIPVAGLGFDTLLESYLLDPSLRQHNLDAISLRYLGHKTTPFKELVGSGRNRLEIEEVPLKDLAPYAAEDADISLRLHNLFTPRLEHLELNRLYADVELPLIRLLIRIEAEGIALDTDALEKLRQRLQKQIDDLEQKIWEEAGEEFNVNSPLQLQEILFDKMELHKQGEKTLRIKKTKRGYSTDVTVLEKLSDHPIANLILEYRTLKKLLGTYIEALPEHIDPETGRLHTSLNQAVTATGRLSSSDPNLQNIPVRTELGREIRGTFVSRAEDWLLLSADYSQIELRILAHIAGDETLLRIFREGADVHRATAARIFDLEPDEVTDLQRSRAKAINYGVIYGMGPQRLARETGLAYDEAKQFIANYFEKYPAVKDYIDGQIERAEKEGTVETLLGRRRLLTEIKSADPRMRAAGRSMAVNTPIQGSAADLIKVAMLAIDERIQDANLDGRMILQIHDELLFDIPKEEEEPFRTLVREEMEGALDLDVPIRVTMGTGRTWVEAH